MNADSRRGQPPVPPAQLALATVLQAYVGCSDDEVIEATTMDRRWQLVPECLAVNCPPFSNGRLVAFRQQSIKAEVIRRLVDRTVALAEQRGGLAAGRRGRRWTAARSGMPVESRTGTP